MRISISICPTELEIGNDVMNEDKYLAAVREVIEDAYPEAEITCLQIGSCEWIQVDGESDSEDAHDIYELLQDMELADDDLYVA